MGTLTIITSASELLAAIVGLVYYSKYKHTYLKLIMPYLWYVFISELSAYFLIRQGIIRYEFVNLYYVVTVVFFTYLLYRTFTIKRLRKTILLLGISFIICCTIEAIIRGIDESWKVSSTISSIFGIAGFTLYAVHLFYKESIENPFKKILTYIVLGFTIFFIAFTIINLARFLYFENEDVIFSLNYVAAGAVVLMYSIFALGFALGDKEPT